MMRRKIELKTREETLQNIILDLPCFHYLFLNRYSSSSIFVNLVVSYPN